MSSQIRSIQFELSKELKEKIQDIFYDYRNLNVYVRKGIGASKSVRSKVYDSSMKATLEEFDNKVDSIIDAPTKLQCIYAIKYNLWKYVRFDDAEQAWYCKNFPNDPSNPKDNKNENDVDDEEKMTKAQIVLKTAKESYDKLFVDENQVPHAAVFINTHLEVVPLKSKRFRNWIAGIVYKKLGIVTDSQTIKDVIAVLSADAEFNGEEEVKLDLRVASRTINNKTIWYIDLTNKNWQFLEITSEGWRIVDNLIIFLRFTNQSPQVYPSGD